MLDPFCGCATACVAADALGRKWVGIDISEKAVELVNMRLQQAMGSLFHHGYVTARTDIPKRTDIDDAHPIPAEQARPVRPAGRVMHRLQGDVPVPQFHHRPRGASEQGRHGPSRQSSAALRGVQLAEGGQAAGVPCGPIEGAYPSVKGWLRRRGRRQSGCGKQRFQNIPLVICQI